MDILKTITVIVTVAESGKRIYDATEPLHDKLKWWSSPDDIEIECPKCGNLQDYTLENIQKGWFSKYVRCDSCDKKIKLDIEVEKN